MVTFKGERQRILTVSCMPVLPDIYAMPLSHIQSIFKCLQICCFFVFSSTLSVAACPQMDSDSHFRKIYENDTVRVFSLELGRLESTTSHCHQHPFFYVVTSDSQTTDTEQGHAGLSHDWYPGAARFVSGPKQHTIRNDSATVHRQVILEILTKVEYNPLVQNYDTDDFANDLGSAKPTWTISVEHGPMSAVKARLAPGERLDVNGRTRLLIALTDVDFQCMSKDLRLAKQDVHMLSPDSDFTVTNTGRFPAEFITIAF